MTVSSTALIKGERASVNVLISKVFLEITYMTMESGS